MQLANKKKLAAKVLKVGKNRIVFVDGRSSEIKEAITRMDIQDLYRAGAIQIREPKGRRKIVKRKHRRRTGKVKKKVNVRKREYVTLTRKLRVFAKHLFKRGNIDQEKHRNLRRMIKASKFKSKRHLRESFEEL